MTENVMAKDHLVTAPVGTTLKDAQEILRHHRIEKLPIVDEKGYLKGLITIKDIEKAVQYPNSARDEGGRLLCGAAIGATADVLDRVAALVDKKERREAQVTVDFPGFSLSTGFIVGYGLDYAERYRELPAIYVAVPEES